MGKRGGALAIRLVLGLAALGAAAFLGLFAYLLWREGRVSSPGLQEARAMIVLGAQVLEDGTPSVQLRLRLETALRAYREHPMPVIVCGARGGREPLAEAEVMAAWLIERGVPPQDITLEADSYDTAQSLRNAAGLLPEGGGTVLVVTSDYHLPRALALARDAGLNALGLSSPTTREYWLKNRFRETLAWGKYLLEKALPGVRP